MTNNNRAFTWFSRVIWIGIFVNLTFAVPAMFFPDALEVALDVPPGTNTVWLRNVGMLLLLLSCFYILVASDPIRHRGFASLAAWARVFAGLFWVVLCLRLDTDDYVYLALVDLLLGVLLVLLLRRAVKNAPRRELPWQPSLLSRLYAAIYRCVNFLIPWHKFPSYLGSLNLLALRYDLRAKNLVDTETLESDARFSHDEFESAHRSVFRAPDGTFTDPDDPAMGAAGRRFARNFPLSDAWPPAKEQLVSPSPREISNVLLKRETFQEVKGLNLLAAAWIQFQNHDWFNHRRTPPNAGNEIEVPLPDGDEWSGPMLVRRTLPDDTRPKNSAGPPTYRNGETHWWDASQIYGSSLAKQRRLRSGAGGKLKLDDQGWLPPDDQLIHLEGGVDLTGFNDNYWVGLSLLHTLFVREHNTICEELAINQPHDGRGFAWTDETLFQTARLINAAVMAKIHTVEWTPGILGHSALQVSMRGNWWGLLGKAFKQRFGRLGDSEAISGIIGSPHEHHAAPYAITEEFVSVYRLHPLIPDELTIRSIDDNAVIKHYAFTDIQGKHTRGVNLAHGMDNVLYTFLTAHPGAIRLKNFPNSLRRLERFDGQGTGQAEVLDLAAIDVLRDRERGVPRYNRFRELLRMPRINTFEDMVDMAYFDQALGAGAGRKIVDDLKQVYNDDVDQVDLIVGMYAEKFPARFGFSDTAFRIFILMASRRLKSDYFFTDGYTAENYTQFGLDWIDKTGMYDVITRHVPRLERLYRDVKNPFAPWNVARQP